MYILKSDLNFVESQSFFKQTKETFSTGAHTLIQILTLYEYDRNSKKCLKILVTIMCFSVGFAVIHQISCT